jgi:hypothetical protein
MHYTLLRVSPGSRLQFPIESEYILTAHQLVDKARKILAQYYKEREGQIIEDFSQTFTNTDPKYGLLVYAISMGYGLGIINYEAFIVKPNKNNND